MKTDFRLRKTLFFYYKKDDNKTERKKNVNNWEKKNQIKEMSQLDHYMFSVFVLTKHFGIDYVEKTLWLSWQRTSSEILMFLSMTCG